VERSTLAELTAMAVSEMLAVKLLGKTVCV